MERIKKFIIALTLIYSTACGFYDMRKSGLPEVDSLDIQEKERRLARLLLSPEQRKLVCDSEDLTVSQDKSLILVECQLRDTKIMIRYTPITNTLSITNVNGSVISDDGLDGDVNFAEAINPNNKTKILTNYPEMGVSSGLEFKEEWQIEFEGLIEFINNKTSSLLLRGLLN